MKTTSATVCSARPRVRNERDKYWKRQGVKSVIWVVLVIAIVGGWLYPPLGFGVLLCMGASVGLAFRYGRTWCDFCPRGTFFDTVVARFSRGLSTPKFLRSLPFRIFMLLFLMGMMGCQLARAWGDIPAMGRVFWLLLTVTTAVGTVLGIPFNPRTWCGFCPMGSMASWIGKGRRPLWIDASKCTACGLCARACPMELNPSSNRFEGAMTQGDCLKCSACVSVCPKGALTFTKTCGGGSSLAEDEEKQSVEAVQVGTA